MNYDHLVYIVSHEELLENTYRGVNTYLRLLSTDGAEAYQRAIISFSGYDDDRRELYEIPEVRHYVSIIFRRFPHLPYLLSPFNDTWMTLMACFCDFESLSHGPKLTANEVADIPLDQRPRIINKLYHDRETLHKLCNAIREFAGDDPRATAEIQRLHDVIHLR